MNEKIRENLDQREARAKVLTRVISTISGIDAFEGRTAEEVFSSESEESRRKFVEEITNNAYHQLLQSTNGVLRDKVRSEWGYDGDDVELSGFVESSLVPYHEHKAGLLEKSLDGAKSMAREGRSMQEIALLLASMIVETHPFMDANGRTSRLVYWMIGRGYSQEESLKLIELMGENGREEIDLYLSKIHIDQIFEARHSRNNAELNKEGITGYLPSEVAHGFRNLTFPDGVDDMTRKQVINVARTDDIIFNSVLLQYIRQHPEIQVGSITKQYPTGLKVLLDKLLSTMSSTQVDDLLTQYWDTKKMYTEEIVDIFVNPDKPEYQIEEVGKGKMRLLDYLKTRAVKSTFLQDTKPK